MFSFGVKRTEDLETYRDITDDVEESDFVPYACHYNHDTLITKNGELLQTIKIMGLKHEALSEENLDLRETIRGAIAECVNSDAYALWFHTIRRKANLSASGEFTIPFADQVNAAWEKKNRFSQQYSNEVYITIVREGQDASVASKQNFLMGILPSRDIRWRNSYIDGIAAELSELTDQLLERLQTFGAKRLTVVERDNVFYSQQCQFLEKIINLVDHPMPMVDQDLSSYLTSGEITFGFNAMEVRIGERRRFAAIITIKEYKEASLEAIDSLLQLPMEFIVTQCADFIGASEALDEYQDQKQLTVLSGDKKLAEVAEIDHILESNHNSNTDFGQQQLSVFILADTIKQLERNVRQCVNYLFENGLVAIREDLRFEECYWAQLPGNFEFIRRMKPTSTNRIAGFANLYNFPAGIEKGNHWGPAITTFHTAAGTPYFFNFHDGENGHTSIMGPFGSGKTVLTHFLLSQSTKFSPRITYFDVSGTAKPFTEALGGRHVDIMPVMSPEQPMLFNPFSLPINDESKVFLFRWLIVLVRMGGKEVTDSLKTHVQMALDTTLGLSEKDRNFPGFIQHLSSLSSDAPASFYNWTTEGPHGHVFNATSDILKDSPATTTINLQHLMDHPSVLIPVFSYLLEWMHSRLDGERSILVLDEAWHLLKNSHVTRDLAGWLSMLTAKNTMAIFSTENIDEAAKEPLTPMLVNHMAGQIYLPNRRPNEESYKDVFGLTDEEFEYLEVMDIEDRHFLLKRKSEVIIGELNLAGLDDIIDVLAGKNKPNPNHGNDEGEHDSITTAV